MSSPLSPDAAAPLGPTRPKTSHVERTAAQPRSADLHSVVIREVREVNSSIRLFKLMIPEGQLIKFRPGQWLDTFVPGVPKAGGFTLTSTPSRALPSPHASSGHVRQPNTPVEGPLSYPYLELAVQNSPSNPPAAYLFRPIDELLGQTVQVRVGGSFVFPPETIRPLTSVSGSAAAQGGIRKLVFVAGGVGINPVISMVSHLAEHQGRLPAADDGGVEAGKSEHAKPEVHFFYTSRLPPDAIIQPPGSDEYNVNVSRVLFLERLVDIFAAGQLSGALHLFFTGDVATSVQEKKVSSNYGQGFTFRNRRVELADLEQAVGSSDEEKRNSVVYACGVPAMTDFFVERLTTAAPEGLGMESSHVLYEKWW